MFVIDLNISGKIVPESCFPADIQHDVGFANEKQHLQRILWLLFVG